MKLFLAVGFLLGIAVLLDSCQEDEIKVTPIDNLLITIHSPIEGESYAPGDLIYFNAGVNSSENLDGLKVIWSSDHDGVLYEGSLDENNHSKFSSTTLSRNAHKISFKLINEVDSTIEERITIYNLLNLSMLGKNDHALKLSWSSVKENFESYSIYRHQIEYDITNGGTLLGKFTHASDTIFTDTTATIGQPFYYQVTAKLVGGGIAKSNILQATPGIVLELKFPISKMTTVPGQPYVYAIVPRGDPLYTNPEGYGLVVFDPGTMTIVDRILKSNRFSDIALDPDGTHLYLCERENTVYKVAVQTRSLVKTIMLSHRAHKIEIGTNNILYYHVTPPTSGNTELRMYDLATDTNLSTPSGTVSHGDFDIDWSNNKIIHGESNSSGSCLRIFSTANNVFSMTNQWGCNRDGSDLLIFNKNKRKVFWRYWVLDETLNHLGTFYNGAVEEGIFAVSPSGDLVVTWSNLYNSNNFGVIKKIPAFYDKALFVNENQLLLVRNSSPEPEKFVTSIYRYSLH